MREFDEPMFLRSWNVALITRFVFGCAPFLAASFEMEVLFWEGVAELNLDSRFLILTLAMFSDTTLFNNVDLLSDLC